MKAFVLAPPIFVPNDDDHSQAMQVILSVGQTPANVKGYVVFGRKDGAVGQDASDFFGAFRRDEELVVIGGTAASYNGKRAVRIDDLDQIDLTPEASISMQVEDESELMFVNVQNTEPLRKRKKSALF
ncbi:hypothetical protein WR25_21540 [Diploscapter pachys]|uniref:Uncharacterized protein n=1 Tax=Diploscapter pachys TaxID=2018661 RepID=A0A2A2L7Y2_9BILA|nr:hypothetical protein WR25_21540 [Diploscapter pachys]